MSEVETTLATILLPTQNIFKQVDIFFYDFDQGVCHAEDKRNSQIRQMMLQGKLKQAQA